MIATDAAARLRPVLCVLALHGAVFFLLYPRGLLVHDETFYVRQAVAFAHGRATEPVWDARTASLRAGVPSPYPPGTSALMALPVWAFGPRGAYLVPWLASLLLVLATAALLRATGYDPIFALLALGFLPTLVLSRLSMSDLPSAALCALSLALLFRAPSRPRPWLALCAGVLAGASLCLRESNPLVLAPFVLGALLRRTRHALPCALGALAGAALRPLGAGLLFGDPFFYKSIGAGFSWPAALTNVPRYALVLCVFVPLGLLWVVRYRGPRRPELLAAVALVFALYAAYYYDGSTSSFAASLVLAPRFFIPLMPLFALSAAAAFASAGPRWAPRIRRLPQLLVAGCCVLVVAVPAVLRAYEGRLAPVLEAVRTSTRTDALVITNTVSSEKFLLPLGRRSVDLSALTGAGLQGMLASGRPLDLLLLARRGDATERARFGERLLHWLQARARLTPLRDQRVGPDYQLRVWRLSALADTRP